jgi:hypothetical protein
MVSLLRELIELAGTAAAESDLLDFKQEFAPEKKAAFWAETIKDIVAFANTRGGIIVFGLMDDGSPSGYDCKSLLNFDNASLLDQIRKYTGVDSLDVRIVSVARGVNETPAIAILPTPVPIVFTKVGTYEFSPGKQKTAFSEGTIYFRHGSKSEPCTREDIAGCIRRQLDVIREEWLGNIRKVVEAPEGATVVVAHSSTTYGGVRITSDPNAPAYRLVKLSDGYPFRQSELIKEINKALHAVCTVNTHDIQSIKAHEQIGAESHPNFLSKPHLTASYQYSHEFLDFVVGKISADSNYLRDCRATWRDLNS